MLRQAKGRPLCARRFVSAAWAQTHGSILRFLPRAGPLSRLSPAPWETWGLPGGGRRESLFTGTGGGRLSRPADWGFVLEHRAPFLCAGACPHPHWHFLCPGEASMVEAYLAQARGAGFAAR